jgi:DNA (cytosine-5)-methyltransferase 1
MRVRRPRPGASFLPFRHELVLDWFAGGGGASTGIEAAIGRSIDLAVNHSGAALAMHKVNHPRTLHVQSDVFEVDPLEVTGGQPVGLAWFSPDCTYFSKARGAKPFREPQMAKRRRGLAWVVVKVAAIVKPRVIMLENVEEFVYWGPLADDGRPNPVHKGLTFRRWKRELEKLGYRVEYRMLRAHEYGAPTIRKRLFVIARRDGRPIVWPKPTHGEGLKPYRTAAEAIDFSIPTPSIFLTNEQGKAIGVKRPLADATLRRIARGVRKYVIESGEPFVIPVTHGGDARVHSIKDPLRTITGARRGELAYVAPVLANTRNGERKGQAPRVRKLTEPAPTVTAEGSQGAVVAAFLAKHYGGHESSGSAMAAPFDTVTARDHHALVSAFLVKYYGTSTAQGVNEPLHTIVADAGHFGIVTVRGENYRIVDIGMRMLTPRELFNAQGFPRDYKIEAEYGGKKLTKEQQIGLVGNSVAPPVAEALVRANFSHEAAYEAAAA